MILLSVFTCTFPAHHKSKWFDEMNFIATHFTSYLNERSKNFTLGECEEHFYPKRSVSSTAIEAETSALNLYDFTALLSICIFMLTLSLLALFAEILFFNSSRRKIPENNLLIPMSKIINFSYKGKCADYFTAIEKFNYLQKKFLNLSGIVILSSKADTDICDDAFEIFMLLVLKLTKPKQEAIIKNELQAFIYYLDSISIY
jgi:hypothetical protein